MISTVERKVRSSVEEEGTVGDVSSRAVREQDFSMSSPTTERRRRRRRGDSCTVTDADENEKTKVSISPAVFVQTKLFRGLFTQSPWKKHDAC